MSFSVFFPTPSNQPNNPTLGTVWTENNTDGTKTDWYYDGIRWLSQLVYRATLVLTSGQLILIGGVIGVLTNDSQEVPVITGNASSFYLTKLDVGFTTSGTLTGSNYWKLLFKSAGSTVQTLNITAGNNNEVTGQIRKSSSAINSAYLHSGRYSVQLVKQGSAPDISSPTVTVEYRLIRA